jgi:2-oxoglutarate dehydrogenase E2 component (dihydrolipoamide succinyltransferase)
VLFRSLDLLSTSGGIVKPKSEFKKEDQEQDYEHEQEVKKLQTVHAAEFTGNSNIFYSPLVLNIARVEGVSMSELETVVGTGTNGRLTKNDLLKYVQNRKKSTTLSSRLHGKKEETVSPAKTVDVKSNAGQRTEVIPMDNNRQRIMNHMINSRDTSVHVTAIIEIDMSRIHNFIEKNRETFAVKEGIKLTYMSFISFAIIKGLKEFPLMNASIDGNNIVMKKYINLGIAVAIEPNGLIVPNIKNADEKNLRGLSKAIADLGNRARTKKLVTDDITDGTFTITNYGVFGSLFGTPIINQPEVGILGVGAVTKKPVVVENDGVESIAIKPMMYLSLSHDHRLVDGMLGGKFLKSIKETLENFDTSLV